MNLKPIRRKLYGTARRCGLRRVALHLDPGARVRLWDKDWNLRADSDRGDTIPSFETVDYTDYGRVLYEPATTIRLGGRRA